MPKALGPNCPKQFLRPQNSKLWDLNFFFMPIYIKFCIKQPPIFKLWVNLTELWVFIPRKLQKKNPSKICLVPFGAIEQWSNKAYGTFLVPKAVDYVTLWSNGLVIKALDSQSRGSIIKTTGWLQGWPSLILLG